MKYVAGVDIGNATTEVALAKIDGQDIEFLTSGIGPTTGIKGTLQNISGVFMSLKNALEKAGMDYSDLAEIRINEAAPVIGDVAMETISETVITESTVIGHNPSTPGGTGIGVGTAVLVTELSKIREAKDVIVIVPNKVGFAQAAALMNEAKENIHITGAIVQADDGVLLNNRLDKKIPIIDEVAMIEKVPLGMTCAIEVAQQGTVLSTLSNPYGIATVFDLTSEETKRVVPIARSLIGARSGVVIKTPTGDVQERSIKAGTINIIGLKKEVDVDVDEGADKIMEAISSIQEIDDIQGETGTNAGNMLNKVRRVMAGLTNKSPQDIKIRDLLAVDTFNPQKVVGGIADEFALENAVGIAAMVKSDRLQMEMIAQVLTEKLRVPVYVGGVEADMAIKGALTTPGTSVPLAIVDMGAGSTDASIINREGKVKLIHLAGAGNMDEFMTALKGNEFYAPLQSVYENGNGLLFDYGMALDLYYFNQIWSVRKKLFKGNDLDEITKAYGEKFDMLNLQFILRSKRYYKMEPAAIYAQLIPVNYKLKKEEITALVEATSKEEGEQIFSRTWYGRKYQQLNLISMEELYNSLLRTVLEKEARKDPYSVAVLYSYLYHKEHEVNRLTIAIECVRYGVAPAEAIEYIKNN